MLLALGMSPDLIKNFLEFKQRNAGRSNRTIHAYRLALTRMVAYFGDQDLLWITQDELLAFTGPYLHGKDAPNMGDLTERLRELKQQRSSLDLQLVALEEEEIPMLPITEDDVEEMADLLRDIVVTTDDQKKLRLFFSSFIDQILVNDNGVRIEYRAEKLVNQTGFDTVRSNARWLPDQGSNLGPAD